jgi:hypothetical protein
MGLTITASQTTLKPVELPAVDVNGPKTSDSGRNAAVAAEQLMNEATDVMDRLGLSDVEPSPLLEFGGGGDGSENASGDGQLCAIAILAGPPSSFNIRPVVFNLVTNEISVIMLDTFRALRRQSLLTQSVFNIVPPYQGRMGVRYPNLPNGRGSVVLEAKGFGFLKAASFHMDPDTYDNPAFGATVYDMNATKFELVYDGQRRCQGRLRFVPGLNASIALISQTNP